MRYKCSNGCKLPQRRKTLVKVKDEWKYDYCDFKYCPECGIMMPKTKNSVEAFFSIYQLNSKLKRAEQLVYKSEFNAAAREAFVVVESTLRQKAGIDLYGVNLVNKALSFEIDKKSGEIIKEPLIAINSLITDSERNEQDGMRFMLMGFFQGMRNIYQHNSVGSGGSDVLLIILQASFILNELDGHSITKKGEWVPCKIDYNEIYNSMPSILNRMKLKWRLRNRIIRVRYSMKENAYND